jgi:hypothetical protein
MKKVVIFDNYNYTEYELSKVLEAFEKELLKDRNGTKLMVTFEDVEEIEL